MDDLHRQTELVRSAFKQVFGTAGKTFGQPGRAHGLSDGAGGVQWNALYDPVSGHARLGVNLEGMKYDDWPIARFIERELHSPSLASELALELPDTDKIIVNFRRDAWQRAARLLIDERHFGDMPMSLSAISPGSWIDTLEEAYQCLDAERAYRGRSKQEVTLKVSRRKVVKQVSPHLNISTVIWSGTLGSEESARDAIARARKRLAPIHEFITRRSALIPSLIPAQFEFDIGGYMGSSYAVKLDGEEIQYTWFGSGYEKLGTERIVPTKRQWKAFRRKLERLDIWSWKNNYSNSDIVDGTSWSVRLSWSDQELESGGSNASPQGFVKVLSAVSSLIGKREFW